MAMRVSVDFRDVPVSVSAVEVRRLKTVRPNHDLVAAGLAGVVFGGREEAPAQSLAPPTSKSGATSMSSAQSSRHSRRRTSTSDVTRTVPASRPASSLSRPHSLVRPRSSERQSVARPKRLPTASVRSNRAGSRTSSCCCGRGPSMRSRRWPQSFSYSIPTGQRWPNAEISAPRLTTGGIQPYGCMNAAPSQLRRHVRRAGGCHAARHRAARD